MNKKFQLPWFIILFSLSVFAIMVTGCKKEQEIVPPTATTETTIPFETIENAETSGLGGAYSEKEPKVVIVTDLDDAEALDGTISQNAQAALQKMDFKQSFALVVFQGKKGSGSFQVDIQRIIQEGDQLIIFAHFTEPQPGYVVTEGETSPYHLIEIPKNGLTGKINFTLNVDGEIIIQQPKFIP